MRDSESIGRGSSKRANGRSASAKLSAGRSSSIKCNGTNGSKLDKKKTKATTKTVMGSGGSKATPTKSTSNSNLATNNISSGGSRVSQGSPRKSNKQSPELRPRRRASQTYFFKYQLAKNPLKAEEEDLKLALLASLQQCGSNGISDNKGKNKSSTPDKKNTKQQHSTTNNKHDSIHLVTEVKRPVGRPPKNPAALLNGIGVEATTSNGKKKDKFSSSSKKGQQYKICANSTNGNNKKRRGSVESSSSRGSSFKDEKKLNKKKKKKYDQDGLLTSCALQNAKTEKPRSKVKSSLLSCNDLTSVQNKIKKAKKLLQNKHANQSNSNAIISKYSALRKFPSNSNPPLSPKRHGSSLLSPCKSKSKSKLNTCFYNELSNTATSKTTSKNPYYIPYSPYTALQKKEPPDEDYLKKYKPETQDFLFFICFRTAPGCQNRPTNDLSTNGADDANCTTPLPTIALTPTGTIATTTNTANVNPTNTSNSIVGDNRVSDKQASDDPPNLKLFSSSSNKMININTSPTNIDHYSPNNHRRPTRQSPRLASSHRKISENDSSNQIMGTAATAYDNSITYEEDMKRASIALEDMAQEINSSDDINNEVAQNSPECISKSSSSPYKNNKHIVKGLMTREFAGAFADEETIFESISNHKL